MKVFGEMFSVLSEEQRNEIIGWVKERVAQNEFNCSLKAPASSILPPKPLEKPTMRKFWVTYKLEETEGITYKGK